MKSICSILKRKVVFWVNDSMIGESENNWGCGSSKISNNIMPSTLLDATAIALSSLIGVFVNSDSDTKLVNDNKTEVQLYIS